MSISEPGGKKYKLVSHQQRGDNKDMGIFKNKLMGRIYKIKRIGPSTNP